MKYFTWDDAKNEKLKAAREDLVPAGRQARELDGVLVRLRAAIGEEEDVDVAGRDLGQLRAQPCARLGRHERLA